MLAEKEGRHLSSQPSLLKLSSTSHLRKEKSQWLLEFFSGEGPSFSRLGPSNLIPSEDYVPPGLDCKPLVGSGCVSSTRGRPESLQNDQPVVGDQQPC